MFTIRIHHGENFLRYPGRVYVSGHVDIFDMVDIDLFTIVVLNMMVVKLGYTGESEPLFYKYLRPLTSLDEGLYALACEEDVCCLVTLVRSFKLIEVYIEYGVTDLDSYIRPLRFWATIEDITDEPGSIATNRTEKLLLLTWHESSEPTKEPICNSVTPSSLPQHDSSIPCKDSTQLSGVQGVDTQEHVILTIQSQFSDINLSFVSQQANASQVIDDVIRQLSFEDTKLDGEAGFADVAGSGVESSGLNVVRCQEPIMAEVRTQEPVVEEVRTQEPVMEEVRTHEPIMEDVIVEDYMSSGEDAEHGNGQKDESAPSDGQFFYDDEGIYTAFETEYDVQSSEDASIDDDDDDFLVDEENEIMDSDVDVHLFGIRMDVPFDNIGVTNLVPDDVLEGEDVDVINADGYDSDIGEDNEITKEAKDRLYLHSIESRRNLKLYKNDSIRIRARCDGKVLVFTMSQGTGPTGPNYEMKVGPSGSSGPNAHDKGDLCPWVLYLMRGYHVLQYSMLRDYVVELQSTNPNTTAKITVKRNIDPFLPTRVFQRIYVCLGALKLGFRACKRDLLGLDGAFMKGPFLGQVLAAIGLDSNNIIYPLAYVLVEVESKTSWCWFLQCLGDDINLHPNSSFTFISDRQKQGWCGQAYKDLLWRYVSATSVKEFEKCMLKLKKMNPKAHEWLNKIPPEHWARSHFSGRAKSDLLLNNICEIIMNVQSVIDKCTGPLTPTATRSMESIKKEAHFMKVKGNGANKYQVSCSLGDQCVVDVVTMTCSCRKGELTGISYKHVVVACWNMALNDRELPPPKAWVNLCYWLTTWKEAYSHKANQRRKEREATGSASRQAQQIDHAISQDGSGGTTVGVVIGLSAADGQGGAGGPGGACVGVSSQVTETRNADGREMGDGIPTQSNAAGGVSEWAFLDNGNFPMVDEEDLILKKISPMAEEIMVTLRDGLEKNCISSSDSLLEIKITKNMSAVNDNGTFLVVDEEDLIFKKISPMAEEIM
ncbi:hypothetical protein Tco_0778414, partial [Tanacetum coccineum]